MPACYTDWPQLFSAACVHYSAGCIGGHHYTFVPDWRVYSASSCDRLQSYSQCLACWKAKIVQHVYPRNCTDMSHATSSVINYLVIKLQIRTDVPASAYDVPDQETPHCTTISVLTISLLHNLKKCVVYRAQIICHLQSSARASAARLPAELHHSNVGFLTVLVFKQAPKRSQNTVAHKCIHTASQHLPCHPHTYPYAVFCMSILHS